MHHSLSKAKHSTRFHAKPFTHTVYSHSWNSHWEQFQVQSIPRHVAGAGGLISQPVLPPEPQLPLNPDVPFTKSNARGKLVLLTPLHLPVDLEMRRLYAKNIILK